MMDASMNFSDDSYHSSTHMRVNFIPWSLPPR